MVLSLEPRLPADWPELTVERIRFQNLVLRIRAAQEGIEIRKEGARARTTLPAASPRPMERPLFARRRLCAA